MVRDAIYIHTHTIELIVNYMMNIKFHKRNLARHSEALKLVKRSKIQMNTNEVEYANDCGEFPLQEKKNTKFVFEM